MIDYKSAKLFFKFAYWSGYCILALSVAEVLSFDLQRENRFVHHVIIFFLSFVHPGSDIYEQLGRCFWKSRGHLYYRCNWSIRQVLVESCLLIYLRFFASVILVSSCSLLCASVFFSFCLVFIPGIHIYIYSSASWFPLELCFPRLVFEIENIPSICTIDWLSMHQFGIDSH